MARLCLGWLSDREWINRLYLYNTCLVICGISMGLSVFMNTYTTQAIYCAIFGVTSGAYVGLTSVVLVDLLGLDKLTNAFGLLLMFQGIASVIGPPIIGKMKNRNENYSFSSKFFFRCLKRQYRKLWCRVLFCRQHDFLVGSHAFRHPSHSEETAQQEAFIQNP